jgi:5-methylcytosine-specific restriction endonuclease McrA
MTKNCKKCNQVKPVDCFSKRSQMKDGLEHVCKACVANKTKQVDPEKKAEKNKRYREANRDKAKADSKKWRIENPKKETERKRKYYLANADKLKEQHYQWKLSNPAKTANYAHARRARQLNNGFFLVTVKELNKLYASSCIYCGSNDSIQMDHVIPISRGGRHSIGNLVPACSRCNQSKGSKYLAEWLLAIRL